MEEETWWQSEKRIFQRVPQPYGKAAHVTTSIKLLVHSMLGVPGGAMLSHHTVIGRSKQCIPHECILISSPSFVVSYASPPTSSFKMSSHLTQTCETLAVSHARCWPRYMCPQRQQPTRRVNGCNIYEAGLRGFWRVEDCIQFKQTIKNAYGFYRLLNAVTLKPLLAFISYLSNFINFACTLWQIISVNHSALNSVLLKM